MFKTKFSGHNKIWGALPLNAPRRYRPRFTRNIHPAIMLKSMISRDAESDVKCPIPTFPKGRFTPPEKFSHTG